MAFFDFLHIFTDLFNSVEKAWNKLDPQIQDALVKGSGVINIINTNLEATPDAVFELIEAKYPDVTKEKLTAALANVTDKLKVAEGIANPDLLTTIKNLQTYFSGFHGKFWEGTASTASQLLSIAMAPDETPFAKIASFIEFVYRKKIKDAGTVVG
jgi:hypothetical protein